MKILLINPSSRLDARAGTYSDSMFPMPPLGLAILAGAARSSGRHEVIVEDQYASRISVRQIVETAKRESFDLVGISCLSPSMPVAEEIVRELKAELPATHVTLGNVHATLFALDILKHLPADSIVMGEGEDTFAELIAAIESGGDLAKVDGLALRRDDNPFLTSPRDPISDLDRLPRPAWDLFRLDDYRCPPRLMLRERVLAVYASRGCPWNCSFCSQNVFMPGIRRRSLSKLVDDIEWQYDELGVAAFGFQDALFPLTEKEGMDFCRIMEERGLRGKVRWFTETRPDRVSLELLREMKRCGCKFVMYGFESASVRHLDAAGKGFKPEQSVQAASWTHQAKLHTYGLFMIGFPNETQEEARATIAFAKRLDCIVASFAKVTPYPGSALYKKYESAFPASLSPWLWNNQYHPKPGESFWQLPGMSPCRISNLLREAMAGYYMRPRMIARHIRHGVFTLPEMLRGAVWLLKDILLFAASKFSTSSKRAQP